MAKLGEICAFQSGGTPSKNKPEYFGGEIPWISTTALNGGKINEADAVAWITPKAIRESAAKIVPANSIMVGTRVGIGKVAINTVEMSTSQDVISLIGIDKDKWYKPYLCKLLLSKKDYFNSQARGATIKGIKIDVVANIDVPEIDYATQRKVAATLNKIDTLIVLRKQQLEKLDELIKARFVEMFGDPADNVNNLPVSPMTAICQIIDGDRGKNYPKQEEFSDSGFCLFLNAKNVTAQGFSFENCTYITEEKDALLRNGKLCRGDVVLTTRGTIGNLAFYDTSVPYENIRINSGMVILRMNKQVVSEIFFIEQFKMQLDSIKSRIASGSAQPQLPISTMNKIEMILPPIELQNQFAAFVERVDQQKQTVQQSLDKLELMKKALMQEYFG